MKRKSEGVFGVFLLVALGRLNPRFLKRVLNAKRSLAFKTRIPTGRGRLFPAHLQISTGRVLSQST